MPLIPPVAFLLILACSGLLVTADDATPVAADPITIVTLGDSITKGVRSGVTAEQTFAAIIEDGLNDAGRKVRVVNVGIGGERTDQAWARLDQVIDLEPAIVTVMYGTNDSYVDVGKTASRISIDDYRSNLTQIVVELLRSGILPVLMCEPRFSPKSRPNGLGEDPNLRLEPYVDACRQVAQAWRLPLVDHFAEWTAAGTGGVDLDEWTTDGCHPNPAGHHRMAQSMLPVLEQAVDPPSKTQQKLRTGEAVRVVCFGDSVTGVYYHTGSRRAYADMLQIALTRIAPDSQVEVINAGISGHTTADALNRIERDVLAHKPDLVTVMFGLNDMVRVPLEDYRANIETIVERCRDIGADLVLATPNNVINSDSRPTAKLIDYCDVVREVARQQNVRLCDCYREFDAFRAHDHFDWRLLMSDAIHPNMDGHEQIARQLARAITDKRISLADVAAPQPAITHTLSLLGQGNPIRVLAMPPFDTLIEPALKEISPDADVQVTSWPTAGTTLAEIEADAKARVRSQKPDLVLIAVPRAAGAADDEAYANSYAWIMNWSLNFGAPTWDCVVVHPTVFEPENTDGGHDDLIRRLVAAQDLSLIDRKDGNADDPETILANWLQQQHTIVTGKQK